MSADTVRFAEAVYVLHVLQKKSHQGSKTPRLDRALIEKRLRDAEELHRARVKRINYEIGSGNVFKDLGLKNPEELLAKAKLASRIIDVIEARKLTPGRCGEDSRRRSA